MSAQEPRLPGQGVTLRIQRDDGLTFAGVTIPTEIFTIASGRTKLAAATGLSAGEIAKANAITFPPEPLHNAHVQREPMWQGPGWAIYNSAAGRTAYVMRDDNSHLSVTYPQPLFTVSKAQAALNATSGLSGSETARIAAMYMLPQ